jgi:hypothetical protein
MLDICVPCKDKGRLRAPYKTIGGIPMCGGCVADLNKPTAKAPEKPNVEEKKKDEPAPLRVAPVKEVSTMGRGLGISQETIEAIRKDAAAGLSLNQIAEKHSVSWPTAKKFAGGGGKKPAGGGDTSSPRRKLAVRHAPSSNGHFLVNLSIVGLDAVWNALPAEKKAELLGNL